ncbi:MAG: hypothetical protein A2W61_02880 [Deltaproteobacteria bacterium RIFCSPLOWO2_01_44_7]|nr:MAG: hypothetical protein A2712_07515 [Deltaproteobacteria bacterium RIFCSPHIGHO2_01_FULL_43_49]OGQ14809.1 MAG: hypothetical protein A3D22_09480 [Deltaproteobacteria bacterium RIFCSPHIGHO2_02_FULL_44_53]OGQ28195.1 MAG: hypothetical protein A3D98_08190 [Deltaproteobacteria bacterium RIFCSPHIGHO2_12_FULL_44_21]OGQ31407.1 MAG: hypothetical protein A2979_08240 [Deltaproteobacteria bacterium RIFCSPLOWO2_01_FULL_45_74]OGQ38407.1 MAG: hypothetical protein A2W61_02880 [Deltaproteobacteria bacterium 
MDSKALLVSLLGHGLLLGLLWYNFSETIRPSGEKQEGFVTVSLVTGNGFRSLNSQGRGLVWGEPQNTHSALGTGSDKSPVVASASERPFESNSLAPLLPTGAEAFGEAGEGGTSEILRQIRNKIERAKFYPLIAKRQNIEGAPVVEFKIQNDGSIEYVRLQQTSGSELLDEAAIQTVKQAGSLPFYPDPIALSIRYALSGKP